ncbi:MAG: HK97 family phage prohead protease [Acidimicrobiales bacterium]
MSLSERRALHSGVERRSVPFRMVDGYSFRGTGAAATDGWQLSAHASITDTPYEVWDSYGPFQETIHRGAFRDTLAQGPDVCLLANHTGLSLARTASGTLRLAEDDRGLRYTADLDPASPAAQTLRSAVQRGDISESSFAFKVTREQWSEDFMRRSVFSVDISGGDVSCCNFGCNKATGEPDSAVALRKQLSTAEMNDLPDSAFAFIESGGTKDASGKTVPRSKRHFCIIDAGHVKAALARIAGGAAFGKEAMPAVLAAAKKFGIHTSQHNSAGQLGERRSPAFVGCNCCAPCPGAGCDGSCCPNCDPDMLNAAADAIANAFTASSSLDTPSAEMLGLPDYGLEARLTILRLAAGPPEAPLTKAEKTARTIARTAQNDQAIRRRIERLRQRGNR